MWEVMIYATNIEELDQFIDRKATFPVPLDHLWNGLFFQSVTRVPKEE